MLYRCQNPNFPRFKDYGGRGITVCERWQDFWLFVEDMGERPKGLTIERINNEGHYEPGNCRWTSKREQSRNRRSNTVTQAVVKDIRRLKKLGARNTDIARWLGVKSIEVSRVVRGETWG